jgi:hypothetical protein
MDEEVKKLCNLLGEWLKYARDMAKAGVIAYPDTLAGKTSRMIDEAVKVIPK